MRADVLDHDFLATDDIVHPYADTMAATAQQQNRSEARLLFFIRRQFHQIAQLMKRILLALPFDHARALRGGEHVHLRTLQLLNHHRRHGIQIAAQPEYHALQHRQRQRQVNGKSGALAAHERSADAPAERGDFAHHHVHADAASGHRRHRARSTEAGAKNKIADLLIREYFVRTHQRETDGLFTYALDIQAGAVVAHYQHDFVALLPDFDQQLAGFRLAGLATTFRRFDAVRNGIAQQMFERRGYAIQHAAIQFDVSALDIELHALATVLGSEPGHAIQPVGQAVERHHAYRHQILLHVARHLRLRRQCLFTLVQIARQILLHGGHVVDAFRHQAREFLQSRETVELQRIELAVRALGRHRKARLHLCLGLNLHFAQLYAQTANVFGQIAQGGARAA